MEMGSAGKAHLTDSLKQKGWSREAMGHEKPENGMQPQKGGGGRREESKTYKLE